jgi:hypothetical protein
MRLVYRPVHRSRAKPTLLGQIETLMRKHYVFREDLSHDPAALIDCGAHHRAPHAPIRIQYPIAGLCHRKHKALYEFDGKLARMNCLLNMIPLHIRENPHIARILP